MRSDLHSTSMHARHWPACALLLAVAVAFLLPRLAAPGLPTRMAPRMALPVASPGASAAGPRTITMSAKRYEFVPAIIEATVGEHLRLEISSEDRVHGFGIEAFDVDVLIPRGGRAVTIDFVASRPGLFEILCTEDCGRGHDEMKGSLIVKVVAP